MQQEIRVLGFSEAPKASRGKIYRNRWFSTAIGALVCTTALLFLFIAAITLLQRDLPVGNLVIIVVGIIVIGIVPVVIVRMLWADIRAGLHRNNWIAQMAGDGIYLNLRSWLNWRLGDATHTIVFVPYATITNVFEVREKLDSVSSDSLSAHAFVVLKLRPGVDATNLDHAVLGEIQRAVLHPSFQALSKGVSCDVPFFLRGEDEIWIAQRDMFLLRALAKRVPRTEKVSLYTTMGEYMIPDTFEMVLPLLRNAIFHGDWSAAETVAKLKLGLNDDETFCLLSHRVVGAGGRR